MNILTEDEASASARAEIRSRIADLQSTIIDVDGSGEDVQIRKDMLWNASDALDAAIDRFAELLV